MKTCLYITLMLALLAAGAAFGAQVTRIDLSHVNGGAIACIAVQGPFQFVHKVEAPKDGKPDRLIVDVLDATHTWGPKEWSTLPACGIARVRIGQFSSKPDKVVRVVFELAKAPIYRVDSDGKSIKIYFTDNTIKAFADWSTGLAPATPPVLVPTTPAPTTNAVAAAPKPTDKPAPQVAVTTPVAPAKVAEKTPVADHAALANKPVATVAKVDAPKPAAPVTTTTPAKPEVKPVSTSPMVTAQVPVQPKKEVISTVTMSKPTLAVTAPPATQPKPQDVKTTPTTSTAVTPPATTAKPEQLTKVAEFKAPTATPGLTKPAEKPMAVTPPATNPPAVAVTDKPVTKSTPPAPQAPVGDKAKDTVVVTKPTENLAPVNNGSPALADAGTPTDGSVAGTVRPTARFRRSANNKMKSSLVAEFPQRLVIKYESMGYRDPFATLIDDSRTYDSPLEQRVPNVDGLKLVGVIESPNNDNRALLEDKHHFSYILQSGDKVQKGYVLRVENDRVYFQIFEYGWSRTIALTIENRD